MKNKIKQTKSNFHNSDIHGVIQRFIQLQSNNEQ